MKFSNSRRFKIIRKIGKRCCFELFEAMDRKLDRLVFLKLFEKRAVDQDPKRFNDTLRVVSALHEDHTYEIYDYGFFRYQFYVASEVSYGRSLGRIMQDDPPPPFGKLAGIFSSLSGTLRAAHLQGVVHGLLNPNCIFIEPDGRVKIDDFGLYWLGPYMTDSEFHSVYPYLAPEVYERMAEVDGRADIYSIGALLSELMAYYVPNMVFSSVYDNLPDRLEKLREIVPKCLHANPNLRYVNVKELFNELVEMNGHRDQSA